MKNNRNKIVFAMLAAALIGLGVAGDTLTSLMINSTSGVILNKQTLTHSNSLRVVTAPSVSNDVVRLQDLTGATNGPVAYASVAGTATNTVNPSPLSVTNNQSVVNFGSMTISNITLTGQETTPTTPYGAPGYTLPVLNQNQTVNAGWVRDLFNNGITLYSTTNIVANGIDPASGFGFSTTRPTYYASRSYVGVTNGQYLGASFYTTPIFSIGGPCVVNPVMSVSGGTAKVVAETYFTYDFTNTFAESDTARPQDILTTTNLFQYVMRRNTQLFTNNGAYYVRRFKVASQTGNPTVTLHIGTNATVTTPSHVQLGVPYLDMGHVYAAHAGLSHTNTVTSAGTTSSNVATYSCIDSIYQIGFTAGDSKVYIRSPGSYLITVSALFEASGNGKTLDIWLRQNGASVPRSSTRLKMPNSGISQLVVVPFNVPAAQGDYFEVAWCSRDDASMAMVATTNIFTSPPSPASPSMILTIQQISAN